MQSAQTINFCLHNAPTNQSDRSKTESTQKDALEGIIDCAWNDYTRTLLKEANAAEVLRRQEAFILDFCDTSSQIAYHMAYSGVQEEKVFSLVKRDYQDYPNAHSPAALMEFIRYDAKFNPSL